MTTTPLDRVDKARAAKAYAERELMVAENELEQFRKKLKAELTVGPNVPCKVRLLGNRAAVSVWIPHQQNDGAGEQRFWIVELENPKPD